MLWVGRSLACVRSQEGFHLQPAPPVPDLSSLPRSPTCTIRAVLASLLACFVCLFFSFFRLKEGQELWLRERIESVASSESKQQGSGDREKGGAGGRGTACGAEVAKVHEVFESVVLILEL